MRQGREGFFVCIFVGAVLFGGVRCTQDFGRREGERRAAERVHLYRVTVWSGGAPVKVYTAGGEPTTNGAGFYFFDRDSAQYLSATGTITVEPLN